MSDSDTMWLCVMFGMIFYLLARHTRRMNDLEEDIDLLLEDEKALVAAKRKLASRQVARETGKDKLS